MKKIILVIYFAVIIPVLYTLFISKIITLSQLITLVILYSIIAILYILWTRKKTLFSSVIKILFIGVLVLQVFMVGYLSSIENFIEKYGGNNYKNISVIVKRDHKLELQDLKDHDVAGIGVDDYNYYKKVSEYLDSTYHMVYGYDKLLEGLDNDFYKAVLLSEFDVQRVRELYLNFDEDYQVIKSYAVEDIYHKIRNPQFSEQSYNIFLTSTNGSGLYFDTGRNDINAILTVNPVNRKILITYFDSSTAIENVCNLYQQAPLNRIGHFGTTCTMQSVSSKLSIPIFYYVKFELNHSTINNKVEIIENKMTSTFKEETRFMQMLIEKQPNADQILRNSTNQISNTLNYLNIIKTIAALYRDSKSNFSQLEIKTIMNTLLIPSKDWIIERELVVGTQEKNYYIDELNTETMMEISNENLDLVYQRIINFMK